MKARNGAIPVPGPTMMMSVSLSSGRMKDLVGDINTPMGAPDVLISSAMNWVHNPPRARPLYSNRTIPTVNSTSPGWASWDEAMEYRRGFRRSASSRNSSGVYFTSNSRMMST